MMTPWLHRAQTEMDIRDSTAMLYGAVGGAVSVAVYIPVAVQRNTLLTWSVLVLMVGVATAMGVYHWIRLRRLRVELTMAVLESL